MKFLDECRFGAEPRVLANTSAKNMANLVTHTKANGQI